MALLDVLRREFRHQSGVLGRHPLLTGLSGDTLTLEGFHRILVAFEAYFHHGEAAFDSAPPPPAPNAPVLSWLTDDFREHGLTSWANRVTFRHPPLDSLSKRVGYLFAKQGLTLDGPVISRRIEQQLGLKPQANQWFFAGYGHDTGRLWRELGLWLGRNEGRLDAAEAVWGTQILFEKIILFCDHVAEPERVLAH